MLTNSSCWPTCWPFGYCKGKNLLRVFGQYMGVVQTPVKLVNVIVGDLPTHETGDYYLTVETGSNPPQITAVVENAEPKFVKFPDEMLIKIRDSSLESNVRFCLKKLNALGSQELCEAYVSPKMLLHWMEEEERVRIRMEPVDRAHTFALPTWILIDIIEYGQMHADHDITVYDFRSKSSGTQNSVVKVHPTYKSFKSEYSLMDPAGLQAQEPDARPSFSLLLRALRCDRA
ncbi:unnamed protein product [Symbiodinium sp. CCMP2456]|nr:unnamed protein product [Symbiodinium sp. CCMP2456]